jgi:hypothetical protein
VKGRLVEQIERDARARLFGHAHECGHDPVLARKKSAALKGLGGRALEQDEGFDLEEGRWQFADASSKRARVQF